MQHQFYLIVPLGLEVLAISEFTEKWTLLFKQSPLPLLKESHGGVTFTALLEEAVILNHYLKTPTRLLLRFAEFKARDFPKLYNKLCKLPWNLFLRGQIPELEFSSKESRIFDSRKVEKVLTDALRFFYKAQPPKKIHLENLDSLPTQKIYIRFENDTCTVSIDTTGERLERRGYRTHVGEASLRGSLASGLLLALKNELKNEAGEELTLIDPMCGSGTFLFESALYYAPSPRQDFSYLFFPYLSKRLPFQAVPLKEKGLFSFHHGKDLDEQILKAAIHNREEAKLTHDQIEFSKEDLFLGETSSTQTNAIICNPPYGERLNPGEIDKEFFEQMLQAINSKYNPLAIGLLFPVDFGTPKSPSSYTLKKTFNLSNGGLKVQFLIWKKRSL